MSQPWRVVFTKQSQKDAGKLTKSNLRPRAEKLIDILRQDPFKTPPAYEKLLGDLTGAYSRRINIHHRVVYQVMEEQRTVKVLRLWTHYK